MCLLDWVEILALEVLDERHLRHLRIRCRAKDDGYGFEPRKFCCAQAAFSGDQFVFPAADVAYGEGLEDAVLRDGFAQFLKRRFVEFVPWLKAVGADRVYAEFGRRPRLHGGGSPRRCCRTP